MIVYTLNQPDGCRDPHPSHHGLTVVHLSNREPMLEPYCGNEQAALRAAESSRLAALLLRNAVDDKRQSYAGARHLMISFYASGTGFIAQMAAISLGMPHIASLRGTDFELDAFDAKKLPKLRAAIEGATQVVTTNRAQASALATMFKLRRPIRTIHNALPGASSRPLWQPPPADSVRLVSDCGFSGRKATHLLLGAAAALIDRGLPVSLTVLGADFWLESHAYWEQCRQSYLARYPDWFNFPGQVSHEELDRYLLSSHIFCSASLAEGSSMGRIRALTIGIPIVSTANGALVDLAARCRHVRLCRAADGEALATELEKTIVEIRAGTLQPDPQLVERWRRHFSLERERTEWISAIEAALR